MQESAVWINIMLYCSLLLIYQLRVKSFTLGSFALIIYSLSAVAGLFYFNSVLSNYVNIKLLPFLYLFGLFLVIVYPLAKFDINKVKSITFNSNFIYWLSLFIGIISIIPAIEITYLLIKFSHTDISVLSEIHKLKNEGAEMKSILYLSFITKAFYFFIFRLSDITPILLFIQLSLPKKNWKIIILLILSIYCVNGMSFLLGSRSILFYTILNLLTLYLIFKNIISKKMIKNIRKYGLIFVFAIFFVFALITYVRYDTYFGEREDVTMVDWVSWYLGYGTLNFNEYVWEMKNTMEGDYCFSYFKDLFYQEGHSNAVLRRTYWEAKTSIPQYIFYTFIGNIVEDFGKIGAIAFLLVISFIVHRALNKRIILNFANVIILCMWCKIVFTGINYYAYVGTRTEILLTNLLIIILATLSPNNAILHKKQQSLIS